MRRPYGPMHEQHLSEGGCMSNTFRRGNACVALFGIALRQVR